MYNFKTHQISVEFYRLTQQVDLPKHLKDQMNRASSSVSLNLAEGNAKFSYKDKARIYQIAYGSFRECQTILELAQIPNAEIEAKSKHLGASLYRLIQGTLKQANSELNS